MVVERDASEFARLSQLGDILGLLPIEINSVHTGLAEQAYRSQVQQVCMNFTPPPPPPLQNARSVRVIQE